MNTAGRRALMGGGVFAALGAGIVIGLAVTNGSADEQSPAVQTTETTVVQLTSTSVVVVAPVPAVETTPVSLQAPTPSAPIVEPVTTPEPVAAQPYVAPAPAEPQPRVTQVEGIVEGPSAAPGATVAPPAPVGIGSTEGVNDSDNHPVG